ncbi:MAG: hypothetical protein J3R72DRAFT_458945 [Linnemannia gamsii]|nr:MAG: hypothetical protein J3R72DRAFT_458945 [Linnemannia gamsii]
MSTQRLLPTEIFALIFNNLTHQDLFRCMRVSSLWHTEAESWLYSTVTLNPLLQRTHSALIQTLKTRRHLLRRVEWRSHDGGGEILPADLLDILLDCRLPEDDEDDDKDNDSRNIYGSSRSSTNSSSSSAPSLPSAPSLDLVSESKSGPAPPPPSSLLAGPNRPSLKHFSFLGADHSGWLLDTVLFNLTTTTLVTLELDIVGCAGAKTTYVVDFGRILNTFTHLKTFSFIGTMFNYTPSGVVQSEDNETGVTIEGDERAEGPITTRQHPLESLTFNSKLMCQEGPNAFSFLERLGNLKKIEIRSTMSTCYRSRPWAIGQALRRYCPNLESIETWGAVVLWFFDLPILPPSKALHFIALVPRTPSPSPLLPELTRRLQDQEIGELLQEDDKSAPSYFPRLKHLVLGHDNSLGAQDLVLLGVQARFLTHVEIYQRPVQLKYVWDFYDEDAAAIAAAAEDKSAMTTETTSQLNTMLVDAVVDNRRLRKRWEVGSREVLLFLQHCSSLCSFSLTGRRISSDDLIDGSRSSDIEDMDDETGGEGRLFIEPWACEDTLETLTIGIDISTKHSKHHHRHYHHALVWKHLGRFKKLRSLTLKLSNLIPSPACGVEGLFAGEGGGRVKETLEEIRSLSSWWKVEDRQAMVLWFAKSCPRLRVLGLERSRQRDTNGWEEKSFLSDEDVKRCPIGRIFIESAYA